VLQTAKAVAASGVAYDQVIYEYGRWVHLGLREAGKAPRGQLLSIGSRKTYVTGLTDNC
jgi:zinc D-Ala-D-Ala carboxypeptidase